MLVKEDHYYLFVLQVKGVRVQMLAVAEPLHSVPDKPGLKYQLQLVRGGNSVF